MMRFYQRWRRSLRRLFFFLLAYLLLLLFVIFVLGKWLSWPHTDRLLTAVSPWFLHNYLSLVLFSQMTPITPSSPFFGQQVQSLSPAEALAESVWLRAQRVSLESSSDCGNFATVDGVQGALGAELSAESEEHAPRTEQEVATALEKVGVRVDPGGVFVPSDCRPRETIAIIIPYRDRFHNLLTFLNYMHRFLQQQKRRYLVVLAEQANYNVSFNRAKLFNAAVRELLDRRPHVDCFVLHDVDKLPYHLLNLYACGFQPRQLATAVGSDSTTWTPYYHGFLGGCTAWTRWQLLRMNGASNDFYGWGGEDDDLAMRAALAGFQATDPGPVRGRMWVMQHHDDRHDVQGVYKRLLLSRVIYAMQTDGLQQVHYKLLTFEKRPLYTLMSFHV